MAKLREASKALLLGACLLLGSLQARAADSAYPKAMSKALAAIQKGPAAAGARRLLDLAAVKPAEFERAAATLGLASGVTSRQLESPEGAWTLGQAISQWQERADELASRPLGSAPLSPVHAKDDARDAQILVDAIPAILDEARLAELKLRLPKLEKDAREAFGTATAIAAQLDREREEAPAVVPKQEIIRLSPRFVALRINPKPREEKIQRAVGKLSAFILQDSFMYAPRNIRAVKLAEYARVVGYQLANPEMAAKAPSEKMVFAQADELIADYLAKVEKLDLSEAYKELRREKIRSLNEKLLALRKGGGAP